MLADVFPIPDQTTAMPLPLPQGPDDLPRNVPLSSSCTRDRGLSVVSSQNTRAIRNATGSPFFDDVQTMQLFCGVSNFPNDWDPRSAPTFPLKSLFVPIAFSRIGHVWAPPAFRLIHSPDGNPASPRSLPPWCLDFWFSPPFPFPPVHRWTVWLE